MTFPNAGDAVKLTDVWPWAGSLLKVGDIGIIGGIVNVKKDELEICWNYSAFRGFSMCGSKALDHRSKFPTLETPDHEYVSCSGGPATIALPSGLLIYTGTIHIVQFWCWKTIPQKDGGEYYKMAVHLWEWDGQGYS